ncbi:MAG TPA: histone H1 [Flavobacteriaceae bacterium]|jgi:hypothetical protein|nr:histone H1 [Flavobacteriaceae bacterium]|tara:strand:+ start:462 stop:638 length:177 start_codon:yes stop_codon:yes gene_type:complete
MDTQKQLILDTVANYIKNVDLYMEKDNKSASTRARKALADLVKICREERKTILEARKK